jgi:hypothetical protein
VPLQAGQLTSFGLVLFMQRKSQTIGTAGRWACSCNPNFVQQRSGDLAQEGSASVARSDQGGISTDGFTLVGADRLQCRMKAITLPDYLKASSTHVQLD